MSVLSYINRLVFGSSLNATEFNREILVVIHELAEKHQEPSTEDILDALKRKRIPADYIRVAASVVRLRESGLLDYEFSEGLFRQVRYSLTERGAEELFPPPDDTQTDERQMRA